MSRNESLSRSHLNAVSKTANPPLSLKSIMGMMGVYGATGLDVAALPFSLNDTTAGNETELQAVIIGDKTCVDLPITIEQSNYFANIFRRAAAGDLTKKAVTDLEKFIADNKNGVWENSWVRFPKSCLRPGALQILEHDLLADKNDVSKGNRTDRERFLFNNQAQAFIRIPVSYLLKLSLADVIDCHNPPHRLIVENGRRLMDHFLSDNTSPETFSFHISPLCRENAMGRALAKETAKRFLLTQLLVMYANKRFSLTANGQKVAVFFSPHPPIRQKKLNACISDAFYRELFMNPCLSGWKRGEAKQEYMHLCHQVLSRSQLNALAKLREAGIITSNLVVLPNTSNISLANNGIHISLGSRKISALMEDASSGFTRGHEKYTGDLTIKILEHFLPLFVGTYSAAPYRLDFADFHPENVLGFLPHELDFTHLRMLWRRWQKKARLKILGQPITPFGPLWLDRTLSLIFRLKGDFIPDYRLIDYLVALMSTEKSPALNGTLQNHDHLKQDLSDLGVFDKSMSLYAFIRMREYEAMGFSGFESRYYSLFPSFERDMAKAVELQNLLHALAFKYMAEGVVTHAHIPDDPFIESERRQITFGCAAGIPTFFVRHDTKNEFLKMILSNVRRIRQSRRYPGYLRVHHIEYLRALVRTIRQDGAELIEMLGMEDTIDNLARRIDDPHQETAFGRLQESILKKAGIQSPMSITGDDLNREAENYYRNDLRESHFHEAWQFFKDDVFQLESLPPGDDKMIEYALGKILGGKTAADFLSALENDTFEEKASPEALQKIIHLLILTIHADKVAADHLLADLPHPLSHSESKPCLSMKANIRL
ncbi:MAG: hypothetical protein PHN75_07290 [Syntrophales bacterium]|nr:hypothetical protein [Syntrophales bacterium]